ncbi:MAG TPA: PKD domain-containing protein [Chitinophagaceae bacterium]|nr:PKD domain-containing protein [Chitinophagaceae bacterium]
MRTLVTVLVFFFLLSSKIKAQDFSNRGRDFWVAYGNHVRFSNGNGQEMVLYLTATQTTNYKIEIPGNGWSVTGTIAANSVVTSVPIPKIGTSDARLVTEGKYNTGIHVTADKPIVAYAHIYNTSVSGAGLLFPTNTLGKEYYSVNFTQLSNEPPISYSWFFVIATEDSTLVEITPSKVTLAGKPAGTPFTSLLMKGEVYNIMSNEDLTGSKVRSINGSSTGCKRIAVFSGSGKINITCNSSTETSSDNLIQQCFPANAWGKKYITVPTKKMENNFFRIAVTDPTTVVKINGVVLTGLNDNFYYEFQSNSPNVIESDKPVMVAQYITTRTNCGNLAFGNNTSQGGDGDPEMIYLSPLEQTVDNVTLNSTPYYQINQHFVNVVIKTNAINSFKIDGNSVAGFFSPVPSDPGFSFAQIVVGQGQHNLKADSGFNAIAYGYGFAESYGYNAGANVIDLYQHVTVQNQYGTGVGNQSGCVNSPFNLSITLPYQPISLSWDIPGYSSVVNNNPTYDSTYSISGVQLYVYKLSGYYSFTSPGTYLLKVTANNPISDGCSGLQEVYLDFEVESTPATAYTILTNECIRDSVSFFDNSDGNGRTLARYFWDFGDGNFSYVKNPKHKYAAAGMYKVRHSVLTDIGCLSDTLDKMVTIRNLPAPDFINTAACANTPIVFTDQTNSNGFTITSWNWDFGDNTGSTQQNPEKTYLTTDTFDVKLYVTSSEGCNSDTFTKKVIINPLPVAAFNVIDSLLCEKNTITFNDSSYTAVGNIIKWNWDLNDGTTFSNSNNNPFNYTYSNWGDYNIQLSVEADNGCVSPLFSKAVHINPLPKPNFVLPEICLNDAIAQFVDLTTIEDGSQSQFSYKWVLDDPAATPANPNVYFVQNPQHTYSSVGNYTAKLIVTSNNGCIDSLQQSFTVNGDNPVADFNFASVNSYCSNDTLAIVNISTVNFGTITKVEIFWDWANNPGLKETDDVPFTNKSYRHVYLNYQTPPTKTFQVRLVAYSGITCVGDVIKSVTIKASPKVQFNNIPGICLEAQPYQVTQAMELGGFSGSFGYSGNGISSTGLFDPANAGAGVHTIKFLFIASNGCRDSATNTIEVWPRPTADFTVDYPTCETLPITFNDISDPHVGNIVQWNWNYGDGGNSVGRPSSHIFDTAGNYMVTLNVVTDRACTSIPTTKAVLVNSLPSVDFDLPKVCLPSGTAPFINKTTIADGSDAQLSYLWNFGDPNANGSNPNTSTVKNPTHNYYTLGSYTVSLTAISKDGCLNLLSKQLTDVFPQPQAKFNSVNEVCEETPIQFTDESTGIVRDINKWQWNFGDGTTSSLQNPVHAYKQAGEYFTTLSVYTTEGCVSNLEQKKITIRPYPVINAGPDLFVLEDGQQTIQAKASIAIPFGSIEEYRWTPRTYLSADTVLNPVIINPRQDITYKLTVTGTGGCITTDEVFVKVLKVLVIPNTFTPNGDGINDKWEIQYLDNYPGCVVEIFNTAGQLLFRSVNYDKPWDGTYKGNPLPLGTYYYVIDPKNGRKPISGFISILR